MPASRQLPADLPVFLLLRLDPERWEPLEPTTMDLPGRVGRRLLGERSGLHSLPGLLAREPKRSVTDLSWSKLTGWRELVARRFVPRKAARALLARLDRTSLIPRRRSQKRRPGSWPPGS